MHILNPPLKTRYLQVIALLAISWSSAFGETILLSSLVEKRDLLYRSDTLQKRVQAVKALNSPEREILSDYIWDNFSDTQSGNVNERLENILLDLDDDKAIGKCVQDMLTRGIATGKIYASISPKIVIATAPLLFESQRYVKEKSFTFELGKSILDHILISPYYSKDLKDWAQESISGKYAIYETRKDNAEYFRDVMRRWWNANKAAFYLSEYMTVKPGDAVPMRTKGSFKSTAENGPEQSLSEAVSEAIELVRKHENHSFVLVNTEFTQNNVLDEVMGVLDHEPSNAIKTNLEPGSYRYLVVKTLEKNRLSQEVYSLLSHAPPSYGAIFTRRLQTERDPRKIALLSRLVVNYKVQDPAHTLRPFLDDTRIAKEEAGEFLGFHKLRVCDEVFNAMVPKEFHDNINAYIIGSLSLAERDAKIDALKAQLGNP